MFDNHYLLKQLPEFLEIYKKKPILDNYSGMRVEHCFALYCLLRQLKPKHVIESGIWRGQTTWLIKQTIKDVDLYSIDIDLSQKTINFDDVNYLNNDISTYDWNKLDKSKTLIIFDDHVCFSKRIDFILKNNFKHIIFDDNLPNNFISYYTPKIIYEKDILIKKKYIKYSNLKRFLFFLIDRYISKKFNNHFKITYNKKFVKIIYPPLNNQETLNLIELFRNNINIYYEFPPIIKFNIKKRFNKVVEKFSVDVDKFDYKVKDPITSESEFDFSKKILDEMSIQYGNICYLNLK